MIFCINRRLPLQSRRSTENKIPLIRGIAVEIHLFAHSGGLLSDTGRRLQAYVRRNAR